jgi:hypothetical protein
MRYIKQRDYNGYFTFSLKLTVIGHFVAVMGFCVQKKNRKNFKITAAIHLHH